MNQRSAWKIVAKTLGIAVDFPDNFVVGTQNFKPTAQLFDFGSEHGMLIFEETTAVKNLEVLSSNGFGYSVVNIGQPNSEEEYWYDLKEMLLEWGWSGTEEKRPKWLKEELT